MAQPYVFMQDQVGPPGRYVTLIGVFPGTPVIRILRVDGTAPAEASASTVTATTSSADAVQFQVPTSLSLGLYAVWVKDGATASAVKYLNQARPFYTEFSECITGSTVMRVFGQNLKLSGATPTVRFENGGNSFNAVVDTANSTENELRFTAPSGLTTSTAYTVYVSNGYGGTYGEVALLSGQTVTARTAGNGDPYGFSVPWAGDFTYSSVTNVAAGGNIQTAIDTRNGAGGGIVQLAAGSYTGDITIKAGVILKGPNPGSGTASHSGKISFSGNLVGLVDVTNTTTVTWGAPTVGSSKIVLHRVTSTHNLGNSHGWEPKGVSNILLSQWVQTCTATGDGAGGGSGRPLNMARSGSTHNTYVHIRGYDVNWLHFRIHVQDCRYATIEGNHLTRDFTLGTYNGADSGGWNFEFLHYSWVKGDTFDTNGTWGLNQNIKEKNDGESLTWQGQAEHSTFRIYSGTLASATSTTVVGTSGWLPTSSTINTNGSTYWVYIVDGTGKGQSRAVSSQSTQTLNVTPAWDVTPDNTSVAYVLRPDGVRSGITDCTFSTVLRGIWLYTGGNEFVLQRNTMTRAEIWLRSYHRPQNGSGSSSFEGAPLWQVYSAGNTFSNPSALVCTDTNNNIAWNTSAGHITNFNLTSHAANVIPGWMVACVSVVGNTMDTLPTTRANAQGPGKNYPEGFTLAIDDETSGDGYGGKDADTVAMIGVIHQGNTCADSTLPYTKGSCMKHIIHADMTGQSTITTTNSSGGLALANAAVPTADTTAPVISSVTSSGISTTQATVTWTTDEASDTQVDWGPTASYGSSTTLDSALATSHTATITGLSAGTLYHYRAKSRDAAGNLQTGSDNTFTSLTGGGTGGSASTHRDGAYSDAIMDRSELALYWPFDETAGSTADDGEASNDGTIAAGVTVNATGPIVSAPVNRAYTFDNSTNASVSVAAPTGLPSGSFTLDAWAKHSAAAWDTIAGWTNGRMVLNANGEILVDLKTSGATLHFYSPEATVGQWGHYTFAYDSTAATGKLYTNGVLVYTASAAGANAPTFGSGFRVGKDGLSSIGSEDPFNGQIARVQLYTGALDASTISELHRIATAPSGYAETIKNTSGLVSYWRMGESSGTTLVDTRGPNNMTLSGSTYTLSQGGAISGDANPGVLFNGGQADVSTPTGMPTTGDWTLTAWVSRAALASYDIPLAAGKWRLSIRGDNDHWIFESSDTTTKRAGNDTNNAIPAAAVGTYHFVALGRSGTTPFLYINATLQASTGGDTLTAFDAGFSTFRVGQDGVSGIGGTDAHNGRVDEISIFSRALSGTEINSLYLLGKPLSNTTSKKRRRLLLKVA